MSSLPQSWPLPFAVAVTVTAPLLRVAVVLVGLAVEVGVVEVDNVAVEVLVGVDEDFSELEELEEAFLEELEGAEEVSFEDTEVLVGMDEVEWELSEQGVDFSLLDAVTVTVRVFVTVVQAFTTEAAATQARMTLVNCIVGGYRRRWAELA